MPDLTAVDPAQLQALLAALLPLLASQTTPSPLNPLVLRVFKRKLSCRRLLRLPTSRQERRNEEQHGRAQHGPPAIN